MLSKDDLKAARETAEEARQCAVYEYEKERRGTGLSMMFDEAATTIDSLLDELERVRKLHSEEQGRSADRLRIAVEALEDVADGPDRHYPGVWIKRVRLALREIKKVGIGNEVS